MKVKALIREGGNIRIVDPCQSKTEHGAGPHPSNILNDVIQMLST